MEAASILTERLIYLQAQLWQNPKGFGMLWHIMSLFSFISKYFLIAFYDFFFDSLVVYSIYLIYIYFIDFSNFFLLFIY
jgi:hypothetical protein